MILFIKAKMGVIKLGSLVLVLIQYSSCYEQHFTVEAVTRLLYRLKMYRRLPTGGGLTLMESPAFISPDSHQNSIGTVWRRVPPRAHEESSAEV